MIKDKRLIKTINEINEIMYELKQMDDKKRKIIQDLAVQISTLPGVKKSTIAYLIVQGFRRQHVRIQHNLVYSALSKEYGGYGD